MQWCQGHTGRARIAFFAAALATVGVLAPLGTAQAATPPSVPGPVVAEAPDYASQVFADAWDYSNRDDLLTDTGPAKLSAPSLASGRLSFTVAGAGYVSPVWGGYPGGLFIGRDGTRPGNQVDASKYTRVSLRAYASQATSGALQWFNCQGTSSSCMGMMPASLKAGWNTYTFQIALNPKTGKTQQWSGLIHGLRWALNGSSTGTKFVFDWMRLYQPGVSGTVDAGGSAVRVHDGTSSWNPWCGLSSGNVTPCTSVDLSMLPAGTYKFAAGTSEPADGDYSSPVQVIARPKPVVLNPTEQGCGDWAKSARAGNRWDFDQATDVRARSNNTGGVTGGYAYGTNAKPVMNDPMLHLQLSNKLIDGRKWRRVTFTMSYSGAFNLGSGAGGGTMARVMWRRAENGTNWLQTNDIVTYSGTRTYTIDLGASGVNEPEAGYRYPITSSAKVTAMRIDPNEDPGARKWRIYDVRLAYTCYVARGGTFPITFKDNAYAPGSVTKVYVVPSTTAKTTGGQLIGTVNQAAGTNTFNWQVPGGQAVGTYWVYLETTNGSSTVVRPASGPLKVT